MRRIVAAVIICTAPYTKISTCAGDTMGCIAPTARVINCTAHLTDLVYADRTTWVITICIGATLDAACLYTLACAQRCRRGATRVINDIAGRALPSHTLTEPGRVAVLIASATNTGQRPPIIRTEWGRTITSTVVGRVADLALIADTLAGLVRTMIILRTPHTLRDVTLHPTDGRVAIAPTVIGRVTRDTLVIDALACRGV